MSYYKTFIFSVLLVSSVCGLSEHVNILDYKKDKNTYWDQAYGKALEKAGIGGTIIFPAGSYTFNNVIDIKNSLTLIFRGGKLSTKNETIFRIISGQNISFIGQGQTTLLENVNPKTIRKGSERIIPSIIDLDHVAKKASPSIMVANLNFKGYAGISGIQRRDKGSIDNFEVKNCVFTCDYAGIAHRHSRVNALSVKDCNFAGGLFGIRVMSPIPAGARVENNTLKNIEITAIRLSGGRTNQVSQGSTRDMMSAFVHGNQIIDSSNKHNLQAYVCGVLVYGYNISIQNNIIRNFNRGERIPGRKTGNQIKMPDGTVNRSAWRMENGKRKRIAGAALYAKGRNVIISNNICSNSGFRAVIEIKTAGLEPYAIVSGNILDGSSLAPHESYGIECFTSKAIWSNNLFYNMPNTAMALRSLKNNTFINNVIYDSRSAFLISDSGNQGELLSGNRLVNVKYKFIDADGKPVVDPQIPQTTPGNLVINNLEELPEPSDRNHGQIVILVAKKNDGVFICVKQNGKFIWLRLKTEQIQNPLFQTRKPVGQNLITNPMLHPANDKSFVPEAWYVWLEKKIPVNKFIKYDNKIFCIGDMNVGSKRGYSWMLTQKKTLDPGKLYRVSAKVKVYSDLTSALLTVKTDAKKYAIMNRGDREWEKLSIDFKSSASGKTEISLYGRQCGNNKKIEVKEVSLYCLQ